MEENFPDIRRVAVTRYVTPLREGGSLPAIVEADDGFMYVLKFAGAGQGVKALIAEIIGGEMARVLKLKVPEIVLATLDEGFGRTEPDEEIQDLLKASRGLNLGLHYLQGSVTFDPVATPVTSELASKIVWLDALINNVDRTVRNTNMLWWNKELWLIDHGAALYFHHSWEGYHEKAHQPFKLIRDHVLLPFAGNLEEADAFCTSLLNNEIIEKIVDAVPEEWLLKDTPFETAEENRRAYKEFLITRLAHSNIFVKDAIHAREALI